MTLVASAMVVIVESEKISLQLASLHDHLLPCHKNN